MSLVSDPAVNAVMAQGAAQGTTGNGFNFGAIMGTILTGAKDYVVADKQLKAAKTNLELQKAGGPVVNPIVYNPATNTYTTADSVGSFVQNNMLLIGVAIVAFLFFGNRRKR